MFSRGGGVAGRGRGEVLLSIACQIDHFGSLEEDISACRSDYITLAN